MEDRLTIRRGDWIALYGSLLPGLDGLAALGLFLSADGRQILDEARRVVLDHAGACVIRGQLFDLGPYPGLRAGEGRVFGEAFELIEPGIADVLDRFEGFDPTQPAESLYLRERVALIEPADQLAWVYFYNHAPPETALIRSGDWRAHRSTTPSDDFRDRG